MSNSLKEQYAQSPLSGANANAVEAMYDAYRERPDSVSAEWQAYFRDLGEARDEVSHAAVQAELLQAAKSGARNKSIQRRTEPCSAGD